jgi:hypothetical protein
MGKSAAVLICGLLACCIGCKGLSPAASSEPTAATGEPKWVSAGGKAFPEDVGKALYGVGAVSVNRFPGDAFMLRKTAEDRGREEIAGHLRSLVASVIKDYAAALAPDIKPDEVRSLTENVQQAVADATLSDAQAAASWNDPQTGATYLLMKLNLDTVAAHIRDRIIAAEEGKLRSDPAAAHKELDRIIAQDLKPK